MLSLPETRNDHPHPSITGGTFLCATLPLPAVDTDGDGMCDVWEARYHAGTLLPLDDDDGDGLDNASEATSGTDPLNPQSRHQASFGDIEPALTKIVVPSQPGKSYQLFSSTNLDGGWTPHGTARIATGSELTLDGPPTGTRLFYRVEVGDADSDGDGLSDWAEHHLSGFDPGNNDSFSSGTPDNDLAAAQQIMQALLAGEVAATVDVRDAYELEATPATVTLTRSGSTTYPLTVFFRHRGADDATKASASPTDFTFDDGAGGTPIDSLVIPAGSASASLLVQPAADAEIEVPEQLQFDIAFVADDLLTRVCDASNILDNERLFYAAYTPEISSPASGYTIIRLQGDNEIGFVSSSFSGLTTPQSAAHIHIKNPVTGPHVESLPMGQLVDYAWNIRAAQFLTTDQAVLDALFNGGLYSNVHSELYPAGEIRADYLLTTGSIAFTPPPPPPPIGQLTGMDLDRDISRFLTQTTFGPTPALIGELRTLVNSPPHNGDRISAFSAWLDVQLDTLQTPVASIEAYARAEDLQLYHIYTSDPAATWYDAGYQPSENSRRRGWWTTALFSDDQLRQRLGTALLEILVTSDSDNIVDTRHYGHTNYYDMLVAGIDGDYRDLLEGVSTHPIMGQDPSHLRNQKELTDGMGNVLVSPDENYAREIMQLFSIGLVQLHPDGSLKLSATGQPIPTYGQDDIIDLARLFTGWSFSKRNSPSTSDTVIDNTNFNYGNGSRYSSQAQWVNPMKQFPTYHDTDAKTILGLAIPAGQTGEAELDTFHDHLAAHSNVAPFISRRLIQRLVSSNPSAGYVHRIATVWDNSGGDLDVVAKAIFLDYEARSLEIADLVGAGKKKEPLLQYTGLARAIQADTELLVHDLVTWDSSSPSFLDAFPTDAGRFREGDTDESLGQTPFEAPSVFNWFLPDYSTGDSIADAGLVTPEFQIATESSAITHINRNWGITTYTNGEGASSLPDQVANGYTSTADHLIPDNTKGPGATQVRELVYMAVMDENGDGLISDGIENPGNPDDPDNGGATVTPQGTGDPNHFDNPTKIREACAALVDHLDLLLCAGTLKADYGAAADPNNPRDLIIDFLAANSAYRDNDHNTASQETVRHERYEKAAYLISVSPQAMIQR